MTPAAENQRLADAFSAFWPVLAISPLGNLAEPLLHATDAALARLRHGDLPRWLDALAALPQGGCEVDLSGAVVTARPATPPTAVELHRWRSALARLQPWRKGPFELAGIAIDAEWRSNRKWDRVAAAGIGFRGARVLDVGAGNGYYAHRMLGAGARFVLGIDPSPLYCVQSLAVQRFSGCRDMIVLPLAFEDLPAPQPTFDVVCSMGVLYHQRNAAAHLAGLRHWLARGGTLVLETLVLPDNDPRPIVLAPERYARMRNVHAVPRTDTLLGWLADAGFSDVERADLARTDPTEQRTTAWMTFQSLADALAPDDPSRTIEGWPAPLRALLVARY